MNCPDCNVKMDLITDYMGDMEVRQALLDRYYKCPKCKIEVPLEDAHE